MHTKAEKAVSPYVLKKDSILFRRTSFSALLVTSIILELTQKDRASPSLLIGLDTLGVTKLQPPVVVSHCLATARTPGTLVLAAEVEDLQTKKQTTDTCLCSFCIPCYVHLFCSYLSIHPALFLSGHM